MIKYHTLNSAKIAELLPGSDNLTSPEDILELMVNAGYSGSDSLIIHADNLPADFFELKTGIAGEFLQKFSNYRMKLSIVGDFSEIKSKNLKGFIRESNRLGTISFVPTLKEALSRLGK